MGMLKEFKEFAMRGNVLDMAVGIVIGAAFGMITSLTSEVTILPPIGLVTGGIDFSAMKLVLKPGDDSDPKHKIAEVAINYGSFINTILTFIIIAFAIFLLVKMVNRLQQKKEDAPAAPPADVVLLTEIRDLLKSKP